MLDDILKAETFGILMDRINEKGYTVRQISKNAKLEYREVKKFINGDTDEMDFLMLVNLCNAIGLNPFDYVRDDIMLKDFLKKIY